MSLFDTGRFSVLARQSLGSCHAILVDHWYLEVVLFEPPRLQVRSEISGVIEFLIMSTFWTFFINKWHSVHHSNLTKDSKTMLRPEMSNHLEVKKKSPYKELGSSRLGSNHLVSLIGVHYYVSVSSSSSFLTIFSLFLSESLLFFARGQPRQSNFIVTELEHF